MENDISQDEIDASEVLGEVQIFEQPRVKAVKTAYAKTNRRKRKKAVKHPPGNRPSDRCITPQHVIDLCLQSLGAKKIGLDVCTEPTNPLGAEFFYTFEDDGLSQPWAIFNDVEFDGVPLVWCNPPYSSGQKIRWLEKLQREIDALKEQGVVVAFLLPSDPASAWYRVAEKLLPYETRFNSRLKFGVPYMDIDRPPGGAGFASVLMTNFPINNPRCFALHPQGGE